MPMLPYDWILWRGGLGRLEEDVHKFRPLRRVEDHGVQRGLHRSAVRGIGR